MFYSEADIAKWEIVSFKFIEVVKDGHLLTITLNRPEKRNAFTPLMVNELVYALQYAQQEQDIWCLIIAANGPSFCAGMDLNVFQNPALDAVNLSLPEPRQPVNLGEAFRMLTKPSIARVNGSALAGAFLIICGCTFVVATDDAHFGLPEVKRGIFPMQVLASLMQIMPPRQAMRMCITAETLIATEAKAFGLVSHLCTAEAADETCRSLVSTITSNSPLAIRKGMEALNEVAGIPDTDQFSFLAQKLEELRHSADAKEGIDAFREKRTPEWKNR